ncbi:MAG: DUF167 domain-containing protein [Rickettsiales bacterium]|jgi:uncharacterized protein (TIGR00251 family)|nr:DUF167 domain-containing protein [Rickettsiales bacterium]
MSKLIQRIRLIPNAKHNRIIGGYGEQLKVTVTAPALDNRANEALVELLASEYGLAKSHVKIVAGLRSKNKVVEIDR